MTVPMTAAMRGRLGVIAKVLGDAGATDRAVRLGIVGGLVGRDLESTKELTVDEARSVLRHLRQLDDISELRMLVEQYLPAVTS